MKAAGHDSQCPDWPRDAGRLVQFLTAADWHQSAVFVGGTSGQPCLESRRRVLFPRACSFWV